MSNRGRHRKEKLITGVIFGWSLLQYKYTPKGKCYLRTLNLDPNKLYKIYLNKYNEICQIEEDTININQNI